MKRIHGSLLVVLGTATACALGGQSGDDGTYEPPDGLLDDDVADDDFGLDDDSSGDDVADDDALAEPEPFLDDDVAGDDDIVAEPEPGPAADDDVAQEPEPVPADDDVVADDDVAADDDVVADDDIPGDDDVADDGDAGAGDAGTPIDAALEPGVDGGIKNDAGPIVPPSRDAATLSDSGLR